MHREIVLPTHHNVRIEVISISEEVERANYGTVGRILNGYHRVVHLISLHGCKDISEGGFWEEGS